MPNPLDTLKSALGITKKYKMPKSPSQQDAETDLHIELAAKRQGISAQNPEKDKLAHTLRTEAKRRAQAEIDKSNRDTFIDKESDNNFITKNKYKNQVQ